MERTPSRGGANSKHGLLCHRARRSSTLPSNEPSRGSTPRGSRTTSGTTQVLNSKWTRPPHAASLRDRELARSATCTSSNSGCRMSWQRANWLSQKYRDVKTGQTPSHIRGRQRIFHSGIRWYCISSRQLTVSDETPQGPDLSVRLEVQHGQPGSPEAMSNLQPHLPSLLSGPIFRKVDSNWGRRRNSNNIRCCQGQSSERLIATGGSEGANLI